MKLSRNFPLNALRVFEAAARLGSFTRAGEELGMTQTAVSYQIKLLEERIGEPLFLRRPRQIALSDTGQRLAPKVSEAFGLLQDAVASVSGDAGATLVISSTQTFASKWLAPHLGSFQLKNPGISVRLETTQSLVDFSREPIDVAIRAGDGNWPGTTCIKLMQLGFTPMLSPKLAATIGGLREPRDLLRLPIFDPSDPWWRQWLTAAGVHDIDLDSMPRVQHGAQIIEADAAISGSGVAILNPEYYADDLALGRLYQPFDLICQDGKAIWLVYPESRRSVSRIRAFRSWILDEISKAGKLPAPHQQE